MQLVPALVDAAVAGHEGADLVPAFLHCLRQRTAKPGTLRFWKIGGDLLTHVQNPVSYTHLLALGQRLLREVHRVGTHVGDQTPVSYTHLVIVGA